jgi:hypothetical protein
MRESPLSMTGAGIVKCFGIDCVMFFGEIAGDFSLSEEYILNCPNSLNNIIKVVFETFVLAFVWLTWENSCILPRHGTFLHDSVGGSAYIQLSNIFASNYFACLMNVRIGPEIIEIIQDFEIFSGKDDHRPTRI